MSGLSLRGHAAIFFLALVFLAGYPHAAWGQKDLVIPEDVSFQTGIEYANPGE